MQFAHLAQRFHSKIKSNTSNGCWIWMAAKNNKGYGIFNMGAKFGCKLILAHRMAFEIAYGEIEEGKEVLHFCDNPACCNPLHLSLGSHTENMRDAKNKQRLAFGVRNGQSKLDTEKVREIRQSGASEHELAKRFGVCRQVINKALNYQTWTHV